MRIAIIATVRTGGRQMSRWIANELGHHLYHEPPTGYIGGFNIIAKFLVNGVMHKSGETHNDFDPGMWDKIITLKRNDVRKAAESMTIAEDTEMFHSHYAITDAWIKHNEYYIHQNELFIGSGNEIIDNIKFAGLKLTYEGIYETGEELPMLKEYLGITNPKHEQMLDKKFKYRKGLL